MEPVSLPPQSRVALCGGTHGNEMSGVYLVRELQKLEKVGSATLTTVISNPRAVQMCKRYTDVDLNRCFTDAILSSPVTDATPYEVRRAQELNTLLGPKGSAGAMDLVCDLHNTTANMGLSLISYSAQDWVILHIYRQIQVSRVSIQLNQMRVKDKVKLIQDLIFETTSASIEVGPQPHGVVRADIFNIMKECFNSGGEVDDVYTFVKSIDYPRDPETNQITAAIHPQLQDRDFCLLHPGDPMFLMFSGEIVKYEGVEVLHPYFVNECAYYEKSIAFHLARKMTLTIPPLRVKRD
uniref:N-acyl-aromatic-L-amino acid amidohydrolase n=1 Tax=Oncorhynchus mykiss TaxID=8022 RepID=A0A8K9WL04_ONCMY